MGVSRMAGVAKRKAGEDADLAGILSADYGEVEGLPARKLRASRPRAAHRKALKPHKPDSVRMWAYAGVALTLTMSAALNGLAFSQSAPHPAAGWALGCAIPGLVLVFSRVSALLYSGGRRGVAAAGAGATAAILLLSIQHLACAISTLTGESVWCAALMAVAIDTGLVVCELATIRK